MRRQKKLSGGVVKSATPIVNSQSSHAKHGQEKQSALSEIIAARQGSIDKHNLR
jgi:hypothetical protein